MAGKNLSAFLTVDLAMNTTKFQKQIKGASDTTKILLTSLNKITVAGKKAADVLGSAFKVLGGLGAGAALTGIYALSRGALDNVKAFEDLSAKISGVTSAHTWLKTIPVPFRREVKNRKNSSRT